jgi:hypothetical protein
MSAASTIRWMARLLSIALIFLFAAVLIDEGPPPILPLSMQTLSAALLMLCLAGLLLAWRWEGAGAALALAGSVGFYLNDFIQSGFQRFPGGWVFPLLLLTPLMYLAASAQSVRPPSGRASSPS